MTIGSTVVSMLERGEFQGRSAERGVLVKETHGSTLRLAPPLVISTDEMDWAVDQLAGVLAETGSH